MVLACPCRSGSDHAYGGLPCTLMFTQGDGVEQVVWRSSGTLYDRHNL